MTLGDFLFGELAGAGVRHLLGVPGDMALNLFRAAERSPLEIITTTNELNCAYMADFYARAAGLGVLAVTYNVGSLSALNGVAEATAERSPLLVLLGAPGYRERRGPVALHHGIVHDPRGGTTAQARAYEACGVRRFAPHQVRQAIAYVRRASRPAFLEVPRDLVDAEVAQEPMAESEGANGVAEAVELVHGLIARARRPVLVAGTEINRYGFHENAVQLAERLNVPVVGAWLGKSAFPETHPLYHGIYAGEFNEANRELMADSDCVVNLGESWCDFNLGFGTSSLQYADVVHLNFRGISVQGERVLRTPLARLLPALAEHPWKPRVTVEAQPANGVPGGFGLGHLARHLNCGIAQEWNIITDVGDAFMLGLLVSMPRGNSYFNSPYYASMGMAVPGALGLTLASGRRTVAVVGDGAFQMTMNALVDCARWAAHPVIVVLNNRSYATLQVMEDGEHSYLRIGDLDTVQVAQGMGCRAARTKTPAAFDAAWQQALADPSHTHVIEMALGQDQLSEKGNGIWRELRKRIHG